VLIDISRTLGADDRAYPGDSPFALRFIARAGEDDSGYTLSEFSGTVHCGTHLDAPAHFIAAGATIDQLPLERFDLPALVIDCPDCDMVTAAQLVGHELPRGGAVLLRTRNGGLSRDTYSANHCAITEDAAAVLVMAGVTLVGIDYISVERGDNPDYPIHRLLLGAGMLLLEDVDLRLVIPGRYRLRCYPLRIADAEAAPCRAVLETDA
jgi:arylformamidase